MTFLQSWEVVKLQNFVQGDRANHFWGAYDQQLDFANTETNMRHRDNKKRDFRPSSSCIQARKKIFQLEEGRHFQDQNSLHAVVEIVFGRIGMKCPVWHRNWAS